MSSIDLLSQSLEFNPHIKYFFIFLVAIFEGPLLIIASGFLLRLGAFDILPLYTILFVVDLVRDVIWYYVGYFFADSFVTKYGRFFGLSPETFTKIKSVLLKYHFSILLVSKLTMGLGLAIGTLMAAGATKISLRIYILINTLGGIFLVAMLLALGFFFGELYTSIEDGLKIWFVLILSAIIILVGYNVQKYIRSKTLKQ